MVRTKFETVFKRLAITAILIGALFQFYNLYKEHQQSLFQYKMSSFSGVIKDTVHYPLQHDIPTYIFTNGLTHLSNLDEENYLWRTKSGDSLSKVVSRNDTVFIFRKNDVGQYVQIYPAK